MKVAGLSASLQFQISDDAKFAQQVDSILLVRDNGSKSANKPNFPISLIVAASYRRCDNGAVAVEHPAVDAIWGYY